MEHSRVYFEGLAYDYGFKFRTAFEVPPGEIVIGVSFVAAFTRILQFNERSLFQFGNSSHIDILEVRTEEEYATV